MKVLFAVSNEEISESIVKKYQREYKEIISYKNVYYFNAILKELQKDKTYDRVVISEDLEAFTNAQYEQIDKFIFEKLDSISDEASNTRGNDIPIILICSERRAKSEELLVRLFGIGIYDALIGNDRSVDEVCNLIHRPRLKKEAKTYYKIDTDEVGYQSENENDVSEMEIQNIVAHYKRLGRNEDKYIESFDNIAAQYNDVQLRIITKFLPINVRAVLEERCSKYQQIMSFNSSVSDSLRYQGNRKEEPQGPTETLLKQTSKERTMTEPIIIPSSVNMQGGVKLSRPKPNTNQNMQQPVQKPIMQNMQQPVQRPAMQNVQQPVQRPTMQNTQQPVQRPTMSNTQQPIQRPTMPNTQQPVQKSIMQNTQQPVQESIMQNTQQPVQESIMQNTQQLVQKPTMQEMQMQPVQKPAMPSIQQSVQKPIVDFYDEKAQEVEQPKTEQSLDDLFEDLQAIDNELSKKEVENTVEDSVENNIVEEVAEPLKRGRGRPRKNPIPNEDDALKIKRGRGRPRKNTLPEENILQYSINETNKTDADDDELDAIIPNFDEPMQDDNDDFDLLSSFDEPEENSNNDYNMLPSFDDDEEEKENNDYGTLPGFEDDELENENNDYGTLPGFEDDELENENNDYGTLPGFEDDELENENNDYGTLPGFEDDELENENNDYGTLPGFEDDELENENNDYGTLPGFEDDESEKENNDYGTLPGFEDNEPEKENNDYGTLPGFEDNGLEKENNNYGTLPGFEDNEPKKENNDYGTLTEFENDEPKKEAHEDNYFNTNYNVTNVNEPKNNYSVYNNYNSYKDENTYESTIDLSNLLTPGKKIVSFVGTSKNGTSFIVNNLAEYISTQMGINTVILDTTKNRNSYYIYTKNEEQLRNTAAHSIQGLTRGITQGISVNKNLTVYTALPDENETIKYVDEILETLLKNYSLILIDADFDTPVGYFKQSQETYLVQTLDILTIQPLTAFLRDLKAKNILDEKKLRVVLNKTVGIKGITEKTIIGGMAYYNDPAMSFMTELFDRNSIKYMTIPFEQEIYTKYLQGIIECEITLKGYSKTFMQNLKMLSNMVYPVSTPNNNTYAPPSIGNMNANMNSTLEQMRRNY